MLDRWAVWGTADGPGLRPPQRLGLCPQLLRLSHSRMKAFPDERDERIWIRVCLSLQDATKADAVDRVMNRKASERVITVCGIRGGVFHGVVQGPLLPPGRTAR